MRSLKHVVPVAMLGLVILLAPGCKKPRRRRNSPRRRRQRRRCSRLSKRKTWKRCRRSSAANGWRRLPPAIRLPTSMIAKWLRSRWTSPGVGRRTVRTAKELIIGDEQWPFPVPLVKDRQRVAVRLRSGQGRGVGTANRRQRTRRDQPLPRLCPGAEGIRQPAARRQTGRPVCSTLSELSRPP